MRRIAHIGSLLKQIYRLYSVEVINQLQSRGFTDLRASFLEILMFLAEHDAPSIKLIGKACGLKKQTMTSHLNELERRGYVTRQHSEIDKREQLVRLTDYGEKFKVNLLQVINDIEAHYSRKLGEVELDRVELMLENLHRELIGNQKRGSLI
ncbi:MAG: MarR family transcriptional regulator [Bacteriovoracaceae bacterium]|nr:MarR family transcriptional regulator [Bacteriovoracaceae bacterium]